MEQGSAAWLDLRARHAATCSEYGNALGVGYISRQKYMRIKLGLQKADEANWMMLAGQEREAWVAEVYFRLMHSCGHPVMLDVDAFCSYALDRRLGGSVDRLVSDAQGNKWLLEVKTCPRGNIRDSVPETHSLQMLWLCAIYNLPYAHYIASTYDKSIFLAEVRWTAGFWEEEIYPRLREFADWWSVRQMPPRMTNEDKCDLLKLIRENTIVTEVPALVERMNLVQYMHE